MTNRNTIHAEIQTIAPALLVNGKRMEMPFAGPPEGYFDTLPHHTMLPRLQAHGKPYSVPNGYFESLPQLILEQAKMSDEAIPETPLLNSISKKMPYSVPEQYLAEVQMPELPKEEAIVVPIRRVRVFSLARWAAAAVVIAGLGWAFMHFYPNGQQSDTYIVQVANMETQLKQTDSTLLQSYLTEEQDYAELANILVGSADGVESGLQSISTKALEAYLQSGTMPEPGS
jgi:hypothetical protein